MPEPAHTAAPVDQRDPEAAQDARPQTPDPSGPRGTGSGVGAPAYRFDLDGLRAVAILLVAVYHVWVHRVSGGVDVFLMISGFFVGGGLLRGFARGAPVRVRTYFPRLARRLLPALVVTVAAVMAAAALWLPRTRWTDVAGESVASLFYAENWRLALSGQEYGAADSAQSPLQHIWSLSVQGQLFVAMPLLLLGLWWATGRLRAEQRMAAVRAAVVVLAVASFVYAVVATRADQAFAYYDTLARAWEYLAGALLAVVVSRVRPGRLVAFTAGWAGLLLVVTAGVLVDGGAQFPGPATLVPIVGAALVVVSGAGGAEHGRASVGRLLAWRPVSRAGGYAYAFYLWHWPVLVFTIVLRDGRPTGWLAGTAVLVLSAVLAVATRHLVEDPARRASERPAGRRALQPTVFGLAAALVLVTALPVTWLAHVRQVQSSALDSVADLSTYPGAMTVVDPAAFPTADTVDLIPDVLSAPEDKVRAVSDGCGVHVGDTDVTVCSYGQLDAERVVAVVGGSHAEQWIDALATIGERQGFRVDTMIRWGCSLVGSDGGMEDILANDPACLDWSENALEELEDRGPDVVFTTATRPSPSDVPGREHVPAAYLDAWARLVDSGIHVIGVRDNPWLPESAVDCVADESTPNADCVIPRADVLDEGDPTASVQLTGEMEHAVDFLDLNDVICPQDQCPYVQGGRIVYRDYHHLTTTYTMSLVPVLEDRLTPLLAGVRG